jgi:hypothetical protein
MGQKARTTHLGQSEEGGGLLPKEYFPCRAVKPIAAYEKGAVIDEPVRKDGLHALIGLLDIGQTMVPANRNSLRLRGVDEEPYQLRAPDATHRMAKHLAYVGGHVVVPEKSLVHI